MKPPLKSAGLALAAAVFFILDRALKWLFTHLWSRADFKLAGDWLSLKPVMNPGLAFGWPLAVSVVIMATVLALAGLVYWAWLSYRQHQYASFFALALIIVGAYSNLFDRIGYGAVIDYISLEHFSVFNLADILISAGIAIILVFQWRKDKLLFIYKSFYK
ncbi:MAG: signal peptidase II [Patescibacteria group bacterium]